MAQRMDGKAVSAQVRESVAQEVDHLKKSGVCPGLAVVIVGEDPASRIYVNNKKKACAAVGMYSEEHALPETTTQQELLALVEQLNGRPDIHGILVQSPLPRHLDEGAVVEAIHPSKDVDAFHAYNVGKSCWETIDFYLVHLQASWSCCTRMLFLWRENAAW